MTQTENQVEHRIRIATHITIQGGFTRYASLVLTPSIKKEDTEKAIFGEVENRVCILKNASLVPPYHGGPHADLFSITDEKGLQQSDFFGFDNIAKIMLNQGCEIKNLSRFANYVAWFGTNTEDRSIEQRQFVKDMDADTEYMVLTGLIAKCAKEAIEYCTEKFAFSPEQQIICEMDLAWVIQSSNVHSDLIKLSQEFKRQVLKNTFGGKFRISPNITVHIKSCETYSTSETVAIQAYETEPFLKQENIWGVLSIGDFSTCLSTQTCDPALQQSIIETELTTPDHFTLVETGATFNRLIELLRTEIRRTKSTDISSNVILNVLKKGGKLIVGGEIIDLTRQIKEHARVLMGVPFGNMPTAWRIREDIEKLLVFANTEHADSLCKAAETTQKNGTVMVLDLYYNLKNI